MPAAGMKKFIVTAAPGAANPKKGMWIWKQTEAATDEKEPKGEQVYVEAGTEVFLSQEVAQPLVDIGRLRLVAG
jgi:hypothetical protein